MPLYNDRWSKILRNSNLNRWIITSLHQNHHIQRLVFKTKVGKALIDVDIFDELSKKFNLRITTILELSILV